MRFFEVDRIVRDNLPNHRLYNWREVERMREDTARYGMALSNAQATLVHSKRSAPTGLVSALQEYRKELRKDKQYEASDRIRDILTGFNVDSQDESS